MLRAILSTFSLRISVLLLFGFIAAATNFAAPFFIYKLTEFIKGGAANPELTWHNVKDGVGYACGLCFVQFAGYFLTEHMTFQNNALGRRSANAVIALIYEKHQRISVATNKEFSRGQIINFVQVDALRLFAISK